MKLARVTRPKSLDQVRSGEPLWDFSIEAK